MTLEALGQGLRKLLLAWIHDHRAVLFVLVALAAGFAIGRYRAYRAYSFQNQSEALLSRVVQTHLGPPDYHLLNHVTLRLKDGTTQIDHVLVSRFGVFVIESKDYKGWIFGDASYRQKRSSRWSSSPAKMSLNRLQFCVGRLETARLAISGETDVEHVQSLARRHGSRT